MSEEIRNRKIICPYCFHEFAQNRAIFRASVGFDRSELELSEDEGFGGLLGGSMSVDEDDPRQLFRKFDSEDAVGNNLKLDRDLIEYWEERGGAAGYAQSDLNWDFPHIDPADPDTFWKMITTEPIGDFIPDEDGFVRDADGFIMRVLDCYSQRLVDSVRLCPDCHNRLPVPDYGKWPVKFISVIGMTSAGKTVYLNQLLTRISEVVDGTDFYVSTNNLNTFGSPIRRDRPLPGSTDDRIMRRPLAVSLVNQNPYADVRGVTLVFYDIAGENCFNENGAPDRVRAQNTLGSFIGRSDGVIFLLDPENIPAFATQNLRQHDIANVVSVVQGIRANTAGADGSWDNVPVAICVAKSDTLRDHPRIPPNLPFLMPVGKKSRGFDREANREVHDFLRDLLRSDASPVYAALRPFSLRAYFAVSAITCGVESQITMYKNQYILDKENERKFRALRKWCEGWNLRNAEERSHYHGCPLPGVEELLPKEGKIPADIGKTIQTAIFADCVHGDRIVLNLWDVAEGVSLMGYPQGDPNPVRVEEPLKWILWQLAMIGPEISFEPYPPKKILESKSHYALAKQAYKEECDYERLRFFWRDEESM